MKVSCDDSGANVMLGIIGFLILLLLGLCLLIYNLRQNVKGLRDEISAVNIRLDEYQQKIDVDLMLFEEDIFSLAENGRQRDKKLVLLEESIDPKNYRWAKIKEARTAISNVGSRSLTIEERTAIAVAVVDASEEFDLPANLILAMIKQESDFNRLAISKKSAKGLMQVMDFTAREVNDWLGTRHYKWRHAKYNVRVGGAYLARMIFRFEGDLELAIRAYNAGPTYVENVNAGIWRDYPEETKDYLIRVVKYREKFIGEGIDW
jgi:hypothetical protein